MLPPTLLQECNALNQLQPEASLSRQPAKEDITTVIDTAKGKMIAVTTNTALSKWLLFKEARGLRVEARNTKETN
jgi:hypothetical protein